MSKFYTYIYILLTILLMTACNNSSTATLDCAEALVIENADSAIAVLNNMQQEIYDRKNNDRYIVLRELAHDASPTATTSDTVMSKTVRFFSNRSDDKNHFLSLYCLGRIYQKNGHAPKAMLAYTQAEQLIDAIDNPAYTAMLYDRVAQLFRNGYDFSRSLEYFKAAHLYYRLAGLTYREHNVLVDISQVLIEMKRYSEAERYLLDELRRGYENSDKKVCQSTIENLLMLYHRTNYPSKASWLLASEYFSICDSTIMVDRTLAYMHAVDNDIKTSNRYMRRAWRKATTINDTLSNLIQMYDISKMSGKYDDALMILENVHYIHDTIMRSALQQPMASVQRDFYQSQSELQAYKLAGTKRIATLVVIAVILLLCIVILIVRNRIITKNAEVERYMELADELSKSLHVKNAEYDDVSSRLEDHSMQIAEMDHMVGVLFKKQFEMLDRLSSTFYETHEIKKDKDAIYRQVRENIESLMNDKKSIGQLEKIVNTYRNGIIEKLRTEIPQLGEQELRFLTFLYAGFSSKAISIFTQESVGNVYTKKSRIKSIISRSASEHKQQFIDAMN